MNCTQHPIIQQFGCSTDLEKILNNLYLHDPILIEKLKEVRENPSEYNIKDIIVLNRLIECIEEEDKEFMELIKDIYPSNSEPLKNNEVTFKYDDYTLVGHKGDSSGEILYCPGMYPSTTVKREDMTIHHDCNGDSTYEFPITMNISAEDGGDTSISVGHLRFNIARYTIENKKIDFYVLQEGDYASIIVGSPEFDTRQDAINWLIRYLRGK
jgi:hypothetical protein